MNEWRIRMQLRRRARRRHLAVVYQRWRATPARPTEHGQASQVLVTLAWLLVPGVLAAVFAALLWLRQQGPLQAAAPRPELGVLIVPLLALWLLRGLLRR
jgi:hypothetical protein